METKINKGKTNSGLTKEQFDAVKKFEAELIQIPTSSVCLFEDGSVVNMYDTRNEIKKKKKDMYWQVKNLRAESDVPRQAWPLSIIMSKNVPFHRILSFSSGDLLSFASYTKAFMTSQA